MSSLNWGETTFSWGNNLYTWEGAHQYLMSQLTWGEANLTWGVNSYTWGDVQLVAEAAEVIITGGDVGVEEWLRQEPKKKKRLIKLIAIVQGQEYVETKEKEVEEVKKIVQECKDKLMKPKEKCDF